MSLFSKIQNLSTDNFINESMKIIISDLYYTKCINDQSIIYLNVNNFTQICFEEIIKRNNIIKEKFGKEEYIINNIIMSFGAGAYFAKLIFNKEITEISDINIKKIVEELKNSDYIAFGLSEIGIKYMSNNYNLIISIILNTFKKIQKKYSKELENKEYLLNLMQIYFDSGVTIAEKCLKIKYAI